MVTHYSKEPAHGALCELGKVNPSRIRTAELDGVTCKACVYVLFRSGRIEDNDARITDRMRAQGAKRDERSRILLEWRPKRQKAL